MKHGKKYNEAAKLVDRSQLLDPAEAVALVKKTATVVTTVAQATAPLPHRRVTKRVARAAAAICTTLVPIRIVVIALSKSSRIASARSARSSPLSARLLTRMRFTEAKAVSTAAK